MAVSLDTHTAQLCSIWHTRCLHVFSQTDSAMPLLDRRTSSPKPSACITKKGIVLYLSSSLSCLPFPPLLISLCPAPADILLSARHPMYTHRQCMLTLIVHVPCPILPSPPLSLQVPINHHFSRLCSSHPTMSQTGPIHLSPSRSPY